MAIITISRELGSLGTEIAQALADQLHYDYIDKGKIASSLAGFGLQAPEVERFDEKNRLSGIPCRLTTSFWQPIISASAAERVWEEV